MNHFYGSAPADLPVSYKTEARTAVQTPQMPCPPALPPSSDSWFHTFLHIHTVSCAFPAPPSFCIPGQSYPRLCGYSCLRREKWSAWTIPPGNPAPAGVFSPLSCSAAWPGPRKNIIQLLPPPIPSQEQTQTPPAGCISGSVPDIPPEASYKQCRTVIHPGS